MSKVEPVILNTSPFRPTDFNEKAVKAVLAESYLIADVKKDGVRLNLCVERRGWHDVRWLSREGKDFPAIKRIMPLHKDDRWDKFYNPNLGEGLFPDTGFMIDAELVIVDPLGTEYPCKTISGTLRRDKEELHLSRLRVYVFDIIPLDVVKSGQPYEVFTSVRKMHVEYQVTKLKEYFPEIDWRVVESLDVFSLERCEPLVIEDSEGNKIETETPLSLDEVYEAVRERGEEGLVIKDPMGYYQRSKVNGWWKRVPNDNEDGKVVGLVWGTEGKANAGKVIGFEVLLESGHVVRACKISKALMDEFTKAVFAATGMDAPDWVNPYEGHTVRVTCMERYPDGSMRHPSFDCFRGISNPLIKE